MSCTPAPTCRAALDEATRRWPHRDRSSDGICASPQHTSQNPTSDHELGNAWDLSKDLSQGVDTGKIADWLREEVLAGRETRVKYLISNRRIFNMPVSRDWRPYSGTNPHEKHMHCSILASARDDVRSWLAGYQTINPVPGGEDLDATQAAELSNVNRIAGDLAAAVTNIQSRLQAIEDKLAAPSGGSGLTIKNVEDVVRKVVNQTALKA